MGEPEVDLSAADAERPERRKEPRFKVNCTCWIEQDSLTLFGTVTNISREGLFLRTLPIVGVGCDVEVRISLDSDVVIASGQVKWQNKPVSSSSKAPSDPPGIGIKLTELVKGQESLDRFIRRVSLIPEPEPES